MLTKLKEVLLPDRRISAEERQYHIGRVFQQHPLHNGDILMASIYNRGFLLSGDAQALADSYIEYKFVYPDENPPFSLHLDRTGVGLFSTPFLRRVSINYDGGIYSPKDIPEDLENLRQDLLNHRFWDLHRQLRSEVQLLRYQALRNYLGVRERLERDLDWLVISGELNAQEKFNKKHYSADIIYTPSKDSIFLGDSLKGSLRKIRLYEKKVLPFLEPGEVIKTQDRDFF